MNKIIRLPLNIVASVGVLLCLSVSAWAYIPPYWMILSRTADNHGHGVYQVDQEVAFQIGDEPVIVNERWTIENENTMRLEVTGKKQVGEQIHLTYIYRDGRRYFVDENGVKKSERIPEDWFEPFLYFRQSKTLKSLAVARGMAPASSLKSEPFKYTAKKPTPDPEPFVRLSRVDGLVAYAIGTPTPPNSAELTPGIWIEQDHFLVRKIRFNSQVEILAQNYKNFHELWVPRDMQITWPGHQAKISVNNVVSLGADAKNRSSFDPADLNFGKNPQVALMLPTDQAIRDFYNHLR
jgi:hypothetical protein